MRREPITTGATPLRALLVFFGVGLSSFGFGRYSYLFDAFVARRKWVDPEAFAEDFALSQLVPGPTFVLLSLAMGLRLGGLPLALAGTLLVLLPGTVAVAILTVVVFGGTPNAILAAALAGTVVGAIGLLAATVVRMQRSYVRGAADVVVALGAFGLIVLGVPLPLVVVLVGAVALWWYRPGGGRVDESR